MTILSERQNREDATSGPDCFQLFGEIRIDNELFFLYLFGDLKNG
jgi:hypothetical protein